MAACLNAKYGLWTNGEDRFVFAKRFQNKSIEFEPIVDIPIFGQSEAEAQRPKRKDLMPATATISCGLSNDATTTSRARKECKSLKLFGTTELIFAR